MFNKDNINMVLEALKNLNRDSAFLNETALQLEFALQI